MPNEIKERRFSHESGSAEKDEDSEKIDTSSNDSTQNFHDNHNGGLFMETSKSQPNAFRSINLFSGAYRQHEIHNNSLGVAIPGEGESIY